MKNGTLYKTLFCCCISSAYELRSGFMETTAFTTGLCFLIAESVFLIMVVLCVYCIVCFSTVAVNHGSNTFRFPKHFNRLHLHRPLSLLQNPGPFPFLFFLLISLLVFSLSASRVTLVSYLCLF